MAINNIRGSVLNITERMWFLLIRRAFFHNGHNVDFFRKEIKIFRWSKPAKYNFYLVGYIKDLKIRDKLRTYKKLEFLLDNIKEEDYE